MTILNLKEKKENWCLSHHQVINIKSTLFENFLNTIFTAETTKSYFISVI